MTPVLLFAATLFLGSFLMFLVEPMIAKSVLPILGGAPMVWNICVLFFQIVLLVGYAVAHGANSWPGSRRHAVIYGTLLILPVFFLPFTISANAAHRADLGPALWLLTTLATTIGLPFLVLSTSASMLQKLFSDTDHPAADDPYFLYAASNLGSLLALLAYPTVVEPLLRLDDQRRLWAIVYGIFVILGLICSGFAWRRAGSRRIGTSSAIETSTTDFASAAPLSSRQRIKWIALSFVPSSLMLAVTTYLSTDIAAVPLLWIVPLSFLPVVVRSRVRRARPILAGGFPRGDAVADSAARLDDVQAVHAALAGRADPSAGVRLGRPFLPRWAGKRSTTGVPIDRVLLLDRARWRDGWAVQHARRAAPVQQRCRISVGPCAGLPVSFSCSI